MTVQTNIPVITIEEGKGLEQQVVARLRQRGFTVATAESCTGGLIAGRLVNVSGASQVFDRGFVTYSNEAKEEELGVRHATLETYSAVSGQTVVEMAEGAAKRGRADAAIAVTGLAGPEGGTQSRPVGLVYVGICLEGTIYWQEYHFNGTRAEIRELTVVNSLQFLLYLLQ